MEKIFQELSSWLRERPKWLQEAAKRLYNQEQIAAQDILDLTTLCEHEPLEQLDGNDCNFFADTSAGSAHQQVRLSSIGNVEGINALQPKNALDFGKKNLAIVYGSNGSGKSGYVRIIKHVCGVKAPGKLHPNVFSTTTTACKCKVAYEIDNAPVEQEWAVGSGPIRELRIVDVFDSTCARFYITTENEVTYEPPVLSFFSELTKICERVAANIESSEAKLVKKKPLMPPAYSPTQSYKWYEALHAETKDEEVETNCVWSDSDETSLNNLTARLAEQNPAEKAKKLLNQKSHLDLLLKDIENKLSQLSNERCQKLLDLKNDFTQKRRAAKEVAERAFQDSKINGIGNETWKLLWKHARQYSESHAYPGQSFPHVSDGALCVLCQQELSDEGKKRLLSFEDYIKDEVNKEATKSETTYTDAIESIGAITTETDMKTKMDASGLEESVTANIQSLFTSFRERASKISQVGKVEELVSIPESKALLEKLSTASVKLNEEALKYKQDASSSDQEKLKAEQLQLQTKKWLSQNRQSVEEEIQRLKKVVQLAASKKLTNTAILSRKKGELAEKLITDAFVQRFGDNLLTLGASRIKVELVKTRTDKGKVLHQLKLKGAPNVPVEEVLSEGEYRVVSLAAFLADVEGGSIPVPFVFDDPITSLDQDYEEAVVSVLIQVAKRRQVIVFTHRISLLVMLQDHAKKNDIEQSVICLKQENWGTGDPSSTPLFAQKPEKALNFLLNERLPQAKKALEETGQDAYDPLAKSLCGDFRILLEKMIECELLADVVQRYRRAVNTQGKINKLALIKEEDCALFDKMMTKYSRYEHSQPNEAPVTMPLPDEIKKDFDALKEWQKTFSTRQPTK